MERRQKVVFQCSICYDRIKKPAMLRDCEHVFCFDCVTHWLESQRDKRSCPFCRCEVNTVTSPIVHIRPRFNSAEIAAVVSRKLTLEELKGRLEAKRNEFETLERASNERKLKYNIELSTLERQLAETLDQDKPKREQLEKQKEVLECVLNAINPLIASHFNAIYTEASMNPLRKNATESYDNILSAWTAARRFAAVGPQQKEKLNTLRKQFSTTHRYNRRARALFGKVEPEEALLRLSNESFSKLCNIMGWNYTKYVHPADIDDGRSPIILKRPLMTQTNRPRNKQPKIMSFFDKDMFNDDFL